MRRDVKERFTEPYNGYHAGSKFPRTSKPLTKPDQDGEPPTFNGMSMAHRLVKQHDGRWPGEDFRFVRRLLIGNVGRPWDEVYSEICQQADTRNFVGYRLREVIDRMVEKNCHIDEEGTIRDGREFEVSGGWRPELYVHPETGLLQMVEGRRRRIKTPVERSVFELDGSLYHCHSDGIWYRVEMKEVPKQQYSYGCYYGGPFVDVFNAHVDPGPPKGTKLNQWYWNIHNAVQRKYGLDPDGKLWYCVKKQSASKREIEKVKKQHKLA
jgi:hypothetical protein